MSKEMITMGRCLKRSTWEVWKTAIKMAIKATKDTTRLLREVKRRPFEISSVLEALALLAITRGSTGFSLKLWTAKSRLCMLVLNRIHLLSNLDMAAWKAGTTLVPVDDPEFDECFAPKNYAEAYIFHSAGGKVDFSSFPKGGNVLDVQYWNLDELLEYSTRLIHGIIAYRDKMQTEDRE